MDLQPEECLFVGDHPANDVRASRAVGMKGVWKTTAQWTDVEADGQIDGLMDLLDIIEKLDRTEVQTF